MVNWTAEKDSMLFYAVIQRKKLTFTTEDHEAIAQMIGDDCSAGAVRNRLGGLRTKANKGEFGKATAGSKSKGGASALSTPSKATPTDDLVASTTPSRSSSSKGHKKKGNAEIDVHEDESAMPRNKKRKVDEVGDDDDDEEVFSEALMGGNRMDVKAELVDDDDDF